MSLFKGTSSPETCKTDLFFFQMFRFFPLYKPIDAIQMSICVCNNANATYEISTTIYANTYIDLYISTHTQLICLQCKSHCKRMYYIYMYVYTYVCLRWSTLWMWMVTGINSHQARTVPMGPVDVDWQVRCGVFGMSIYVHLI